MSSRTVDLLLDERARLTAQRAALEGHLWAAEALLLRSLTLCRQMLAESPAAGLVRDQLADDLVAFLSERRPGPSS